MTVIPKHRPFVGSEINASDLRPEVDAAETPTIASVTGLQVALDGKQATLLTTAVKAANYSAAAKDYVLVDALVASRTVTLPAAPADGSRVGVKMVAVGGSFTTSIACGGSDHFNTAAGPTSVTLVLLNQAMILQYVASTATWTVQADDMPLGQLDARFQPAFPSGTYDDVLVPTAVKTANYTAAPKDFVPVDTTAGSVAITLPTAPADKSRIAIKHVIQGGTNLVTYTCGGSDTLNKTGGATSGTLTLLAQAVILQYKASSGIWYVQADDLPVSQLDLRYPKVATTGTLASRPAATVIGQRYLASDTAGGTLYESLDGSTWTQMATGVIVAGRIIGQTVYNPASIAAPINNSTTYAPVDATNLTITLTFPANGKALVTMCAATQVETSSSVENWALLDTSNVLVAGTGADMRDTVSYGKNSHVVQVTGAAGSTVTYRWGQRRTSGSGNAKTLYGGAAGAAVMTAMECL